MFKKVILLLLFLLIFSVNINNVYAESLFGNNFISDVQIEEAIKFVYDNGGILEGEEFNQYDKITVAEIFIILERMYGNPDNLPATIDDWNISGSYKKTWDFDSTLIKNNYNDFSSRKTAAHLIFSILDIEAFKTFHIKNDCSFFIDFGMYEEDIIDEYTITFFDAGFSKAEFCYMLEFIHNNKDRFKFPVNFEKVKSINMKFERFEEDYNMDKLLYLLYKQADKIPDNIINKFNEKEFRIIIFPSEFKKKYDMPERYYGMYFHGLKEIRIPDNGTDSFIHEIGHFVGFDDANYVNNLYKLKRTNEYNEFFNVLDSDYYKTNNHEYFAEVFKSYFKYPERLKNCCPLTYDYIDSIIKNFK